MKTGIIGSGNVGITTAFNIAERGSSDVQLYDIVEGRAKGKALDLIQAAPLRNYDVRISGTDNLNDLMDSDIFVLSAGEPRTAGMARYDLFDKNYPIVKELARTIKENHKGSELPVILVLTEPVDFMTLAVLKETGYPREKIIGVSGVLSAARLRSFIGEKLGLSTRDIDATVVGSHEENMVILERYCRISGLPLSYFLEKDDMYELFERTRKGGDVLVELAKTGGSFYPSGEATGIMVDALSRNTNKVMSVSTYLTGEYGVEGRCISVPVKLGKGGIKKIFELQLTDRERDLLQKSVATQDARISKLS